jgi:hypothetical protein
MKTASQVILTWIVIAAISALISVTAWHIYRADLRAAQAEKRAEEWAMHTAELADQADARAQAAEERAEWTWGGKDGANAPPGLGSAKQN